MTNTWLIRAAQGLTSGALALTMLSGSGGVLPMSSPRLAAAEDIDCYNDKDLYNLPECVERRANDAKEGNQQTSVFSPAPGDPGQQVTSGGDQGQPSGGGNQSSGGGSQQQQQQQPPANNPPPSGGNQQQQQQASSNDENDNEEAPRGPATDANSIILTFADAGKQATQYDVKGGKEGDDKYGHWAHARYERDRSDGASTLGPNVIDTKAWVAKDLDSAKALFKEQSAVKDFPERTEAITGPNQTVKPACRARSAQSRRRTSRTTASSGSISATRFARARTCRCCTCRPGQLFFDRKDKTNTWNGFGDWYPQTMADRM